MILHTTFCKCSKQKICLRQTDVSSGRFCHTRIKLTIWMFRNYPSENLKSKKVSFIKQQLNDSIFIKYFKANQYLLGPTTTDYQRLICHQTHQLIDDVNQQMSQSGMPEQQGGSLPVSKHFHCADAYLPKRKTNFSINYI